MLTTVHVNLPTFPRGILYFRHDRVMMFSSFEGSLDLFPPSHSISQLRFVKQMFHIGTENAFWTCPYHENGKKLKQGSCSNG